MANIIGKVFGEEVRGYVDFFRYPDAADSWGGPFNGQQFRKKMFDDIEDIFLFKDIFETGTYHGTTTAHFTEK